MNTEVPEVPYIIRPRQVHRFAVGLFGALLLVGAAPAVAGAACPKTVTSNACAAFGDTANYTLVEGGRFESGAPGWSLTHGYVTKATPEEESHRYDSVGEGSRHSLGRPHALVIASGGEAVSPP